jgi:hypothetical protein
MGATGWSYRTPYQPDIGAALAQLRAEVFARGEYHRPRETADGEPVGPRPLRLFRPDAAAEPEEPGPASIEELLTASGESGTHSILDIVGLSDTIEFGAAAPVPDAVLLESFGTTRPTAEQAADYPPPLAGLIENLQRWQAVYFVVYEAGRPHEIHFEGRSGD